ncbi:TetR/AcrR family transcriptional regulator [Streptomyces sp. NPDC097610]|uniref:TetR/AcrR family transcriptional regulator n=1 Tax=Streptomyces sp. NPDC097610 TaxID=3157227 RepID=UPI00332C1BAD
MAGRGCPRAPQIWDAPSKTDRSVCPWSPHGHPCLSGPLGNAGWPHGRGCRPPATADALFYAEGVQSVGIDHVIEHAKVAKATVYGAFGSKDDLVRACLQARHAATAERMARGLEARYDTPKEHLVGAFEVRGLSFTEPGFRGCAFIGASADARARRCRRTDRAGLPHLAARAVFRPLPAGRRHGREVTRPPAGRRARTDAARSCSTTAPGSVPGRTTTPAPRQPPAP